MYISNDDQTFVDKLECARHEFKIQPELLARLNEKMARHHISVQTNWCGGDPDERNYASACACMGCANHDFRDLGLEYAHWKVWIHELREEQPTDNIPNVNTDVDVIIVDFGDARIAVFKLIREFTGLGVLESKQLMDRGVGVCIKAGVDFYDGTRMMKAFEEVGCTARLLIADKQRWTRLNPAERDYGF